VRGKKVMPYAITPAAQARFDAMPPMPPAYYAMLMSRPLMPAIRAMSRYVIRYALLFAADVCYALLMLITRGAMPRLRATRR